MKEIHIGCASLNQTPLDWSHNVDNIKNAVEQALGNGIDVLCLPELALTGYNCEDMFLADWVIAESDRLLKELAHQKYSITLIIGHPFKHDDTLFNCASIIANGEIKGIVPKRHLAKQELYYEPRWFTAWTGGKSTVLIDGKIVPFGDLTFIHSDFKFGIEICEDAWSKTRPAITLIKDKVDIIFNLSASHFAIGKMNHRLNLGKDLLKHAPDLTYGYSNLLGNESGRVIYDGSSFILNNEGLDLSPRFSFKNYELISKIVKRPISRGNSDATSIPIDSSENNLNYKQILNPPRDFENFEIKDLKFHEFTYAVSLGIYDYIRKSANQRIVISLSGGADSATCAILSKLSFDLAIRQKGKDKVAKDLRIPLCDIDSWDFLYCLYQKTENNSDRTEKVARGIADHLGCFFKSVSIDETVSIYKKQIEDVLNTKLTWDDNNIALQNIQARTRSPLIWFLANLKNAILIATSNRSEAAVGYTTMDGDTSGGLSPIGGISKSFILEWLNWLEKNQHDFGNYSFLAELNNLQPSAELKPLKDNQTDEQELMPYDVLESIEQLFVKDKISPSKISDAISKKFPEYSSTEIGTWIDKFLTLWRSNQWKRERYAPCFHLDEESLDPKTWFRYPILSGKLQIK